MALKYGPGPTTTKGGKKPGGVPSAKETSFRNRKNFLRGEPQGK
jgi:hypothetical protein